MRKKDCIIEIYHADNLISTDGATLAKMKLETGDVNKIEVIDILQQAVKILAQQVVAEGAALFGNDRKAFDAWVLRQQLPPTSQS